MASKMPNSDKWELIDNDSNSQWYGDKFKFDFSYIESDSIKDVAKAYVWRNYKEGNKTVSWLYREVIANFKKVNEFLELYNITNLNQLYFILNLCAKFSLKSQPSIYGKYGKWIL